MTFSLLLWTLSNTNTMFWYILCKYTTIAYKSNKTHYVVFFKLQSTSCVEWLKLNHSVPIYVFIFLCVCVHMYVYICMYVCIKCI